MGQRGKVREKARAVERKVQKREKMKARVVERQGCGEKMWVKTSMRRGKKVMCGGKTSVCEAKQSACEEKKCVRR